MDVSESEDPEGLRVFYYLVQDVKARHASYHPLLSYTNMRDSAWCFL